MASQQERVEERRSRIFEKLLDSYAGYFDVERDLKAGCPGLAATAQYHSRAAKYVLSRKAELWGYETHEYVFVFSIPTLDETAWDEIKAYVIREGLALVRPHKEHMCSYVTAVALTDCMQPGLEEIIRKTRYSKSFKLSFHGNAVFRAAVLNVATGKAACNREAREMGELMEKYFKEES